MKIQWKKLVFCLLLPLFVGGLSALLTGDGMERFQTLNKPPLSPPGWMFPIAWTILYLMMGYASYLVLTSRRNPKNAWIAYGVQLFFNFFWSIIFFRFESYLFAFIWLVLLWAAIIVTIRFFCLVNRTAGYLMIPYLVWVTFAGYLNLGVYLLN